MKIYAPDSFDCRDIRFAPVSPHLLATKFFVGPQTSTSTATTREDEYNGQTTASVGSGNGVTIGPNGGSGDDTNNVSISETSVDPSLLTILGNDVASVAGTAIQDNTNAADTATAASVTDLFNSLGFGAQVVQTNADLAGAAIDSANRSADDVTAIASNSESNSLTELLASLGFGAQVVQTNTTLATTALNDVVTVSADGQQEAQAAAFQAELTTAQIASDLAQITANSAPQTTAAESEILSGDTPINPNSVVVASSNNWETYAVVGGFILTLIVFFRTHGKGV